MVNDLTIMKNGQVPAKTAQDIARAKARAAEITKGIAQPFTRITYKQGKWGVRKQGVTTPLYRLEQVGNDWVKRVEENLDVIIMDVGESTAKVFYLKGYDGSAQTPDCCSSDGIRPDQGVSAQQSPTCASCKWNRWGSRKVTEDRPASRGKECADYKKMVIVPVMDIENKNDGGPMMLQVPPSSLKAYKGYVDKLAEVGFEPDEVWTRVSFEENKDFPLFVFDAPGVLNAEQRTLVGRMKTEHSGLIERILNSKMEGAEGWDEPEGHEQAEQAEEPEVTGNGKMAGTETVDWPTKQAEPEPVIVLPDETDPYTYSPDKTLRWKAGMAAWEAVPAPQPPPLPAGPPPLPAGPPPLPPAEKPKATKATKRTAPPSPEPHDSSADRTPPPKNPAPVTGNGKRADPDVTAKIAAMVDKLV